MQEEETKQEKWYKNNALHIVVAAVSGILIALVVKTLYGGKVPDGVVILVGIVGTMWIQSLKAVVVPLIFCAMIQAVQVMKALKIGGAKKMIQSTVGYYLLTASTASLWGMFVALVIMKPQLGIIILDESVKPTTLPAKRTVFQQIEGLFLGFVPANIVGAFANNQVLAIISIALTIGYLIDSKSSAIYKAVVEIERMVYIIVDFLIKWSPIGILSLLASNIMNTDLVMLTGYTAVLVICTISALLWQFFINYPLIYFLVVRRNPFPLVGNMTAAALTAFGSASSAATMPVTLECAEKCRIPPKAYKFTIPLGTSVNMDGAAIYYPISVLFLATVQGIVLSPVDLIVIVILATLNSLGTTPVPSASLVLIFLIAEQVGVPVGALASILFAIDFLLDRFRTVCNVAGDIYAASAVGILCGMKYSNEEDNVLA